jgi:hypothetical protein
MPSETMISSPFSVDPHFSDPFNSPPDVPPPNQTHRVEFPIPIIARPEIRKLESKSKANASGTDDIAVSRWAECRMDLDAWFRSNLANPHPRPPVMLEFSEKWDVPIQRLRTYFINRRGRYVNVSPELKKIWTEIGRWRKRE